MNPFDHSYVGAALKGHWDPLARHIKEGGEITPAMRELVAQVLFGERKLPRHRPVRDKIIDRKYSMAKGVVLLERKGVGTTDAVEKVARHFRVTTRLVWDALRRGRCVVESDMNEDPEIKEWREARKARRGLALQQQYKHPDDSSLASVEFYLQWEEREARARERRGNSNTANK